MMGLAEAWAALLGRQRKASASGPLVAMASQGKPVWTPRRYDKLAEEGYQKNIIAFRCIGMTAGAAAAVPWKLHRGSARLGEHPLLALLRRPNPGQGGEALFEALYAYYLIAGNAYLEAVGPEGRAPRELHGLRPDRMRVVPGAAGLIEAYEYKIGGKTKRWPVEPLKGASPMLHLKAFHPLNDWYGMSPIEAAAFAIDQHNAAGAWNKALLDNGARPSGALIYAPKEGPANLTDEQFERLRAEIEESHGGVTRAGRPMLLDGGLEWREMSLSPKDMDWLRAKDTSAREVALAFNVPPQLVGIPDAQTYSNVREARLAFYDDAVLPLLAMVEDELNNWLAPSFGANLSLAFDRDGIEALSLRRERKWATVKDADFLTVNEKRQAVGFAPVGGGDVILVPAAQLPLATAAETGLGGIVAAPATKGESAYKLLSDGSAAARRREWTIQARMRAGLARALETRLGALLENAAAAAAEGYEKSGSAGAEAALGGHGDELRALLEPHWRAAMALFGERLLEATGSGRDADHAFHREVEAWIARFGGTKVERLSATTRVVVRAAIEDGTDRDLGGAEIARLVRERAGGDAARARALAIGRTETHQAAVAGGEAAARASALPLGRQWIAAPDGATRPSHAAADGQRRALDAPFEVDGASLACPGDPAGPAAEVAGCRCVVGYGVEGA